MSEDFESHGYQCLAPSLTPANGSNGLVDLALKLEQFINDQTSKKEGIILIGFSMGTIVSRAYMQVCNPANAKRVRQFHSISGPHKGTLLAHLSLGRAARDMRYNSQLLRTLNDNYEPLKEIEVHNYRTPWDQMIIPSKSSEWALGKNHVFKEFPHHRMIINPRVIEKIRELLPVNSQPS